MSVDDSDYQTLHRKWRAACEAAQAERDANVDLRRALDAITKLPVGACGNEPCDRCGEAHDIARAALEGTRE
jgi:hypothetical protein